MAKKPEAPKPLQTYGIPQAYWPANPTQLWFERAAFLHRWPIEKGGLPRFEHFKNICKIFWPWLEWNPWMERGIEALCNNRWVGMTGCASSTKTCMFVTYAVVWWLCDPERSSVVLTSTTKGMIRKRAWPWLVKLYTSIPGPRVGNLVDSKTTWQCEKGNDLSAIFGIAVKEGSTAKAMGDIQGIHNKRVLVGVDEATDTPQAIFDVCANLMTGCTDFQFCAIGNAASRFDPHGKFCEPAEGWGSVSVDDDDWETVPQLDGKPGVCIHFDAEKSPNIVAGETKWRFLPTRASVEGKRSKLGPDSPLYWKFDRGFWAPEGIAQTVLTESLLIRHEATGGAKHIWTGQQLFKVASCDPAFGGGDRPVFRVAECGTLENGALGIQLLTREFLSIRASSSTPLHYQLAEQIKSLCARHGIAAAFFGLDVTGEGGGLADILAREWSPDIVRVEFGGKPSEMPASHEDRRPCSEVYFNKVSELWFTIREFVTAGQLKGILPDDGYELTNRLWRLNGRRIQVEPKSSRKMGGDAEEGSKWGFRERMKCSPDLGDAIAVLCHVAKTHGVVVRSVGRTAIVTDNWQRAAVKMDDVNLPPDEPMTHEEVFAFQEW